VPLKGTSARPSFPRKERKPNSAKNDGDVSGAAQIVVTPEPARRARGEGEGEGLQRGNTKEE